MKIILGSSSPSRKKLLKNTGIDFKVKNPTIDETAQKKEFKGKGGFKYFFIAGCVLNR